MPNVALAQRYATMEPHELGYYFDNLSDKELETFMRHWPIWARPDQLAPNGKWPVWLILAGRGFGKTRAGAEWVRNIAEDNGDARFALVGANFAEARTVMVEGESGLLSISTAEKRPTWEPSLKRLRWDNGAEARLYSAAEPEGLRGPQHSHAWCDEIAKWMNNAGQAKATWDNLKMGLRLGECPQIVATTTPRPVPLVRALVKDKAVVITKGRTQDNDLNLPVIFLTAMKADYGGTRLGRQELDGELIEQPEGALWTRDMIEVCRIEPSTADPEPVEGSCPVTEYNRIVIGVDPPASATGDACGIIVAGLGADDKATILADCSVEKASPEKWARAVADAADIWNADKVIAEANQGGAMVKSVLQAAKISLPVKLVHASRGKVARAEPVAALYENNRVHHAGTFPRLEDELCGLLIGRAYDGPGRSPDRADALVYALTELMLGKVKRPNVRNLI
ncbi:DNA-packaging protein [Parasphingorhabdus halotolerans]|uniref:DNA-packaging protein n=1 Tax=Parasphingorhabdus halotolerans TaxID=2725558 RepID=A0A6H2DNZ9_9SPHN|nr:terminase family protein [Parasphingorhabdus halotolerans]QJB69386.1 DNA-packaging protein [Parasphingorhabdus halotolerans]